MSLAAALLDLAYPRSCAVCGADPGESGRALCWDCRAAIKLVDFPYCRVCGDPVDGQVEDAFVCAWCTDHPPAFDRARSAACYRGPLRRLVHAFKYNRQTAVCRDLVEYLDACVASHYADVAFDGVLAVPLHARKERERTYNQSALLAAGLARARGLPLLRRGLARAHQTSTQTRLSAVQRRRNVRNAFHVLDPEWIDGRVLLLVDDVMTTGATVHECSRVLKKAGAGGVYIVTVARG